MCPGRSWDMCLAICVHLLPQAPLPPPAQLLRELEDFRSKCRAAALGRCQSHSGLTAGSVCRGRCENYEEGLLCDLSLSHLHMHLQVAPVLEALLPPAERAGPPAAVEAEMSARI